LELGFWTFSGAWSLVLEALNLPSLRAGLALGSRQWQAVPELNNVFRRSISLGAQWKQAGREANAQKKGQLVVKLVREIMVAAKLGGPDPDLNARLAAAVEKARKNSVTRDTIERAIKKGAGLTDEKIVFELITYEGFAPHKVPVVVECLTDNRNRTAPEIRNLFKAGSLGQPGSVGFFFNHLGVVEATHADANRDAEGDAIEAGAQEIEALEAEEVAEGQKGARFLTEIKDLDHVAKALKAAGWNISASEIRYVAKSFPELTDSARKDVVEFLNALDDHEDVHRVYAALK
jgi:YebC/PmpR family DNA-binding regulatory protein